MRSLAVSLEVLLPLLLLLLLLLLLGCAAFRQTYLCSGCTQVGN